MPSPRSDRLSPPIMYVFRAAHEAKDARKPLDLRDEAGDRVVAARRRAGRQAITEPVLRREVATDIGGLMNTTNLDAIEPLDSFPEVRRSILNFGFPDLAHRTLDEGDVRDIAGEIEEALRGFEPRLIGRSLHAERDETIDGSELKVRFVVRADLQCDPVNVPVEFVADVEFDTGKIKIERL